MDALTPQLSTDAELLVQQEQGGPVPIFGSQGQYVIMSANVYAEMLGLESDEALSDSLAKLQTSIQQMEAGKLLSEAEVFDKLENKCGG